MEETNRPIDGDDDVRCLQRWLAEEENDTWLDIAPTQETTWAFRLFLEQRNNMSFVFAEPRNQCQPS